MGALTEALTPKRRSRRYTELDIAKALAVLDSQGGNVNRTARLLGMPQRTLACWARARTDPMAPDARSEVDSLTRNAQKESLAQKFENVANRLVDRTSAVVDQMGGYQAMVAAGIATDKMRLLRGQSTGEEGAVQIVRVVVQAGEGQAEAVLEGGVGGEELPAATVRVLPAGHEGPIDGE